MPLKPKFIPLLTNETFSDMKLILILAVATFFSGQIFGQNDWMTYPTNGAVDTNVTYTLDFNSTPGKVTVHKDPRIDKIQDFTVAEQETVEGVKIDGYRVLIFFDQDKTVTQQQKAHFMSLYPEHKAYIDFLAPNYRVRVGNFRTRLEAEALKSELLGVFPTAIVVKDKIQLPELPGEENTNQ